MLTRMRIVRVRATLRLRPRISSCDAGGPGWDQAAIRVLCAPEIGPASPDRIAGRLPRERSDPSRLDSSMTPLALSGTAKSVSGATVHTRHLLRLREAHSEPVCEADAAIVRDDADLSIARDQGFGTAIIFDPCSASDPAYLGVMVHLDGR